MLLSEGEKPTNCGRSVDGRSLVGGAAPEGFSAQALVSRAAASTPVGAEAVLGSAPRTGSPPNRCCACFSQCREWRRLLAAVAASQQQQRQPLPLAMPSFSYFFSLLFIGFSGREDREMRAVWGRRANSFLRAGTRPSQMDSFCGDCVFFPAPCNSGRRVDVWHASEPPPMAGWQAGVHGAAADMMSAPLADTHAISSTLACSFSLFANSRM